MLTGFGNHHIIDVMDMKKTSILRKTIEDIWESVDLNESKIKLRDLMSAQIMNSELKKRRLLMDIGNCQSKQKLNEIATNCMLKFEGMGVIG
jgi:hypothetical protein